MWILRIIISVAEICSLGLESVKAREVSVGQDLIEKKKKKRKNEMVAQRLQGILKLRHYSCALNSKPSCFFITAV